ncbi:transmembrane protein 104 homolog [Eurytemora carolleeae]|uniref:transmembrane protein 104 homolog n=1 Tax=Eurytemora carolleeae TaxID=1294199 RepID=UPI000C7910B1|nr:transmembrane protein 104 homolog [Eurytemora carolleeae]XP_023322281.1 transmembrane protein 104 homolog [Eurytemora carolleeae]XP_023322290.1 transmembrane protein 104 homolog [Eurytemora carolleeae]|eukprot:XP_023322274.1 transmembrane protein 104 homolog [Eurytemora affinis]
MVGSPGPVGPPTMSPLTAGVFIFNLIVGTGALALPSAFQAAGWLVGIILLLFLALTSYITATWVLETMAACNGINAVQETRRIHSVNKDGEDDDEEKEQNYFEDEDYSDQGCLVRTDLTGQIQFNNYGTTDSELGSRTVCNLNIQLELATMADMLYNKTGKVLFSLCMILYLYGDLAIYCTALSKSLRDVTCTVQAESNCPNGTNISSLSSNPDLCWSSSTLTKGNVYRIYVGLFLLLLGPFTFFNVTKTKYLQMLTTLLRWVAFSAMIGLSISRILDRNEEHGSPAVYSLDSIPAVFGVSVYSFMCHHSIPSLISPVKNKNKIGVTLAGDYLLIAGFYLLLSLTGIFAFPSIPDLYTLAFKPDRCGDSSLFLEGVDYFLALFPVFTLSTSFPIIGITLRNNLESILVPHSTLLADIKYRRIIFPLLGNGKHENAQESIYIFQVYRVTVYSRFTG